MEMVEYVSCMCEVVGSIFDTANSQELSRSWRNNKSSKNIRNTLFPGHTHTHTHTTGIHTLKAGV